MHWCDEVIQNLLPVPANSAGGCQVINDSKTPSGRAHVGALRGVLIHDAVFRSLKNAKIPVRYLFGCDDYDPVDEIPYGQKEVFAVHLGKPLCNVPPPPGSSATDMADHFIKEFWSTYPELGVACEFYRMRDIYRAGKFNEPIDRILRSAEVVRKVYKDVSNSDRPAGWLPFQVICENCGRIGTTECTNYDGATVEYVCKPDLVEWAKGCGHRGKMSPFDGRGKLPWKLEWVAKWVTFPVTIEGAGEDHSTKGGSRDVAAHCLQAIYNRPPPVNIPYGFVLLGGAKMSSSKGIGATARDMVDFIPPEILRFSMIRPQPKRQANFEPTQDALVKFFNEFDRAHKRSFNDPKFNEDEKKSYLLSEPAGGAEGDYFAAEFGLVIALVQMPHLDVHREFEKIKGVPLTEVEKGHLERRIHAARVWLENYATPEERMELQKTLPARTAELTPAQRGFLHTLAEAIGKKEVPWAGEALQTAVFDAARLTPIDQPSAFAAIYRVLFDKSAGPKAGNMLAFLDRAFVVERFKSVPMDVGEFWKATAIAAIEFRKFLKEKKAEIAKVDGAVRESGGLVCAEFRVQMTDGKTHLKRVLDISPGDVEGMVGIGSLD